MEPLQCVVTPDPPFVVVRISGELMLCNVATVRNVLLKCVVEYPSALLVDVSDLTVTGDTALSVFAAVARRADRWPGVPLVLCASSADLYRRFLRSGVHHLVALTPSWIEAMATAATRPTTGRRMEERYRPEPGAPRHARALARRACVQFGVPELDEAAALITTELVTNAVRHAGTAVDVRILLRGDHLHVTVRDGSPVMPQRRPPVPHSLVGAGLRLVEASSTAWGVCPLEVGKAVWATLRVGSAASPPTVIV